MFFQRPVDVYDKKPSTGQIKLPHFHLPLTDDGKRIPSRSRSGYMQQLYGRRSRSLSRFESIQIYKKLKFVDWRQNIFVDIATSFCLNGLPTVSFIWFLLSKYIQANLTYPNLYWFIPCLFMGIISPHKALAPLTKMFTISKFWSYHKTSAQTLLWK